MVFKSILLCSLFLSSVALASISSSRLEARRARRHANRHSHTRHAAKVHARDDSSNVQNNDIWAGAVLTGTSGALTSVTGTFTVPSPSGASGDDASIWIGIDGYGCGPGLLQAGIDFGVTGDGSWFGAWYEWYPASSDYYSDIDVNVGDVLTFNVTAYSETSGIAIVENHTTNQKAAQELSSSSSLCMETAEWIIEDYEDGTTSAIVPFADFGKVTFVDAVAAGPGGTYSVCSDGDLDLALLDLQQNGQVLATTATDGCNIVIQHS